MSTMMCGIFISLVMLYWMYGVDSATVKTQNDAEVIKVERGKDSIAFPDDLDISKFSRQNHMYMHFQHSPEFHRNHPGFFHHHHHHHNFDSDESEEKTEESDESGDIDGRKIGIPLQFIQNINEHNVSDLLLDYIDGPEAKELLIEDRFGDDDGQEKSVSSAIMAKEAKCMPESQTIKIASSDDPSILYIPQCTRVERCGGCCKHDLLSCQPIEKETLYFKVLKTQYTGEKKLKFLGKEQVMVEQHTKCQCDCKIKRENCTKFQEYREKQCQCVCINNDDRKKCEKSNNTKFWNPDLCTCQCRDVLQCSTGSYFDQSDCKCSAVSMKRRFAEYQKRSNKYEPSSVVPLDEY